MYENLQSSHTWHDHSNSTFYHERVLAEKGSTVIDYTVFGMAVITIGLLMVVGAVRYFIDVMAKGKFFFENVLEAVYHELSTLGLVEAGVFLVLHYYPGLNINVKNVFAEVHFTLFYVAIINAIMSVLLYLFTSRVAEKQWVRMETIDLDHYVAIRKQFEAIEFALKEMEENDDMKKKTYNPVSSRGKKHEFAQNNMTSQLSNRSKFEQSSLIDLRKSLVQFPIFGSKRASLIAKYRKLLVQVRFHELRVHFIDCNKLDPRFKVSEYLKLCMNDVFHSLVHISFVTWLILLVFTNVVYFLLGVISAFADEATVGTILTWVHIGYSILFLFASLLIANKMQNIFFLIMKNDHWVRREGAGENSGAMHRQMSMSNVRDARAEKSHKPSQSTNNSNEARQEDYFWGGDPAYIVFAAQVMQFGFALELGVMLVFNESVKINIVDLTWWGFYLLVPLVAYLLFLWTWSFIIPQFTQCTSLGELIHSDHLNETQAMFKLTEARLLRQEEIDMAATEDAINKRMISSRRGVRKKQLSTGLIGKIFDSVHSSHRKDDISDSFDDSYGDKLMQLSSFVKRDTKDLPDIEPSRRRRRKAVSEGVSAMRFFTPQSSSVKQALEGDMESDFDNILHGPLEPLKPLPSSHTNGPSRPRRLKSASTGVFMMRHGPDSLFSDPSDKNSNTQLKSKDDNDVNMFSSTSLSRVDESRPMSKESILGLSKAKSAISSVAISTLDPPLQIHKSGSSQKNTIEPLKAINQESNDDIIDQQVESDTESTGFPDLSEHPEFNFETIEISFSEQLKSFFIGLKYRRLSAVFGTLLVFFLLGTRMELILLKTCKIKDNENTWDYISLKSTFIMTTLWLCGFIIESSILIYTFYNSRFNSMVAAGLFDILLTIACLSIFLAAESQRCCDCEGYINHRMLVTNDGYNTETCDVPCCPSFGTRLCGGVGTLEPFTSLIGFRLFRFVLGKWSSKIITKATAYLYSTKSYSGEEKEIESASEDITEKDERCEEIVNVFEHKEGTIADLWAASLLKFPDLVEKHGPFSGLLLEAMLGIQPLPSHAAQNRVPQLEASAKPPLPMNLKKSIFSRSLSIGSARSAIDSIDENERAFDRPASTLIRSMRRCQFKWLPLLDSWEDVDVVLTKYELAWFGTVSINRLWDNDANEKDIESKRLIRKSGGGKGLRLCDVVSGREMLGRLQLSEIESVKVVRYPVESKVASQRIIAAEHDEEFGKESANFVSEYWQDEEQKAQYGNIEERWNGVTEDVLTIRTPQGTLCLRFLADLVAAEELVAEDSAKNSPSKRKRKEEGALLWCQTILYIQSKERVIHTEKEQGGDGTHNCADFIEVVGDTKKQRRWFQNSKKYRGGENLE